MESKINDDVERKLSDLQNNIQHVENRMRFTDSEKRTDDKESQSKIKKNDLEIKQLRMEVKELQVRMDRCKKADENVAYKAYNQYSLDFRKVKGKSAKEIIQSIDAEVIELEKRRKELEHELELKRRVFKHNTEEYKKKVAECDADFENEPTEDYCHKKTRELQNEQQDLDTKITDCEIGEGLFKRMKAQLGKNRLSQVKLLLEARRQSEADQKKIEKLIAETIRNNRSTTSEEKTPIPSGGGDFEPQTPKKDDASNKKKVRFPSEESASTEKQPSDQESELLMMKERFEKIKETTGVYDIQDVEGRFLEQKSVHEDILDLKKRLSKTLHELKTNKKQQDSKMELMQGANPNGPKRELENTLHQSKRRQKEQDKRKENARKELHSITSLLENVELRFQRILRLLGKHLPQADSSPKEMTVTELGMKIERLLQAIGHINEVPCVQEKRITKRHHSKPTCSSRTAKTGSHISTKEK